MYPLGVVPFNPFHSGLCHIGGSFPRAARIDELPLVQAVERLRSGIIVRIALGAGRTNGPDLAQPAGIADRSVLHATIGMADKMAADAIFPPPDSHLQSIGGECSAQVIRDSPPSDPAGIKIHDERGVAP